MATKFDATFFDSLSDHILTSLYLFANECQDKPLTEHEVKLFGAMAHVKLVDFCTEVFQAHDRRFGEVPGY